MSVLVLPRLDPSDRLEMVAPAGATLAEIVALALPGLADKRHARVMIGDQVVEPHLWHRVRPKSGVPVLVRMVPGNSGLLRSVLTIAVTIAAVAVGGGLLGGVGASLGLGTALQGGGVGSALAAAGTLVVGNLLINALVPTRTDLGDADNTSPTYGVQGLRNVANPDGPVPRLLGEMVYAPPYLALPYTEVIGDQHYVIAAFLFGYGPLELSDFRIGDTPLSDFDGVTLEVREGYPDDAPLNLYPQQVIEDQLSVGLTQAAGWVVRQTATDVSESSVDISFVQGLVAFTNSGTKVPATVQIAIRYRKVGDTAWTNVATLDIVGASQQPLVRSHRWAYPERGQYEVGLSRVTVDFDTIATFQATGRSDWTALRSFRPEYPVDFPKPLAVAAVRIRATNQLNGMLDTFNGRAKSLLPDWDVPTQSWVTRATRNPASHYRHVLTGNAIAYPFSTDEMEALEDWHEWCVLKGLTYDRVHDFKASVLDVLSDIAAAGRATPQDRGGTWSVVIDRIQDVVRAHISPRNSFGFSGQRSFTRFPDALRVKFKDSTNRYADAERVVPWPGFSGAPDVTEALDLPGITDPARIWIETRRRQYELIHRPDTYAASQDFEMLASRRGDLVRLAHTVLDRHQAAARVVAVVDGFVSLDAPVTMEDGLAYAVRFRLADGASLLRSVATVAGETTTLRLTGSGDLPEAGDLALFGLASQESLEVIVKSVAPSARLTAKMQFVDHAPQIETLTDAEVPPPWDGRFGGEIDTSTAAPGVPAIASIVSGVLAGGDVVIVSLAPGTGAVVPAAYVVEHRLTGATSWLSVTIPAGEGAATLTGYAKGDSVDVRAHALSAAGTASASTAVQVHVVGATDPTIQDVTAFSVTWTGTTWRYEWTLESLASGMTEAAGVRIRYAEGDSLGWGDLAPLHTGALIASPWDMTVPAPLAVGESYTFGAVAVTAAGELGTPTLVTVSA